MKTPIRAILSLAVLLSAAGSLLANNPGGGTGTGPNVTLVDNGATVTWTVLLVGGGLMLMEIRRRRNCTVQAGTS